MQSRSIIGGDFYEYSERNNRPYNRDVKIFDLDEIKAFIKSHSPVRLELNESGIRFKKDDLSKVLTLVHTVNNRFTTQGQFPAFIQGIFIKLKDL